MLSPALSGTEVAFVSKRVASGSEEAEDVKGLNLKWEEEEPRGQDRRVNEEEQAPLVDETLTLGLEEDAERRIGSKRVEVLKARFNDLQGLGRGREGVRVKAVLCILRRCQIKI